MKLVVYADVRVQLDWYAKRQAAVPAMILAFLFGSMIVGRVISALMAGYTRFPFSLHRETDPVWFALALLAALGVAALCFYAAYRDWRFFRLVGKRLRRRRSAMGRTAPDRPL